MRTENLLRIRRRTEEAGELWREKNKHPDYLLKPGLPLSEAEALLSRRRDTLEDLTVEFIERSAAVARDTERRETRELRIVATTFALLALLACVLGWNAFREATLARTELSAASRSDFATAHDLFSRGEWRKGIAYLGRSLSYDPTNKLAAFVLWQQLVYGRGDR